MSLWDDRKSGIFMIRNIPNGKMYIGMALDLRGAKWRYFDNLRKNQFKNQALQEDFNNFQESEFEFEIIEFCPPEQFTEKRNFYVNFFGTKEKDKGYNVHSLLGKRKRRKKEYIPHGVVV